MRLGSIRRWGKTPLLQTQLISVHYENVKVTNVHVRRKPAIAAQALFCDASRLDRA
jgi:hypothetical protein